MTCRGSAPIHVHSPILQGQLNEKNRQITLIVWMLERDEKKIKKIFSFVLKKFQSVSTSIFQGLFKNIDFRSGAFGTKKVMGNFRFV